MKVLHPHLVAGPQKVYEGGGVLSVYVAVHMVAVMVNGGLVGEAVKDRPEDAVGEYVVETLDFVSGKGDGGQTHAFDLGGGGSRGYVFLAVGVSVPAHPDAPYGLDEGPQAAHESPDREGCVVPPRLRAWIRKASYWRLLLHGLRHP